MRHHEVRKVRLWTHIATTEGLLSALKKVLTTSVVAFETEMTDPTFAPSYEKQSEIAKPAATQFLCKKQPDINDA